MMLIKMTYLPPLAKNFAPDASVWRKKYHVFCFVVVPVLKLENIVDSLVIQMQRRIENPVEHLR